MSTRKLKQGIERQIELALQDENYKERRQATYDELAKLLSVKQFYDFLIVIDSGFNLLAFEQSAKDDIAWGRDFDELRQALKAVLRKNKRLGSPFRIIIINSYMLDDELIWKTKLTKGRPVKLHENLLVQKMFALLAFKTSQQNTAYIIHDIFEFFYGRNKGIDSLEKQVRKYKKKNGLK